jgi:hypothetical protein
MKWLKHQSRQAMKYDARRNEIAKILPQASNEI